MNVDGSVSIVTGGAGGIGEAIARSLVDAGGRVVVTDVHEEDAAATAESVGHTTEIIGVGSLAESTRDLRQVIAIAEEAYGPVDLFFANAGAPGAPGIGDDDGDWGWALEVNVLAHVRAARLLLPGWLERGNGYFVSIASAAGLLTMVGAAAYAVSKHAAVAFAEWLAITYGDDGVRVSCVCPMGVDTRTLSEALEERGGNGAAGRVAVGSGEILSSRAVADQILAAVASETFLVLPHPQVTELVQRKASDPERWLRGMRRLQARVAIPCHRRTAVRGTDGNGHK